MLNDNVYRLVKVYGIRPHLAVLDGYQGTEGEGPVSGIAIATPQQLAVASLDWLAADRVALALMGSNVYVPLNQRRWLPMPYPACLNYLWQAGLGEWDLRKIQVLGEPIAGNVYNYRPITIRPQVMKPRTCVNAARLTPKPGRHREPVRPSSIPTDMKLNLCFPTGCKNSSLPPAAGWPFFPPAWGLSRRRSGCKAGTRPGSPAWPARPTAP